jgi:hypothetical protein
VGAGSALLLAGVALAAPGCSAPFASRPSPSAVTPQNQGGVECPDGKPARSGLQNFGAYIGTWDANHVHDGQVTTDYVIGSIPGRVAVRCTDTGYVIVEMIAPRFQSPAGQALRVALTDLPDDAEKVYDHTHAGCRVLQYRSAKLALQLGAADQDGRVDIVFRSETATYNPGAVRSIDLDVFDVLGADTRAC